MTKINEHALSKIEWLCDKLNGLETKKDSESDYPYYFVSGQDAAEMITEEWEDWEQEQGDYSSIAEFVDSINGDTVDIVKLEQGKIVPVDPYGIYATGGVRFLDFLYKPQHVDIFERGGFYPAERILHAYNTINL